MQTVICAFETQQAAQRAMNRLIESGFSKQNVYLEAGSTSGMGTSSSAASTSTTSRSQTHDEGFMSSVGNFFSGLFGDDSDSSSAAGTYSEAVRRGNTVMAVDVMDEAEEEQAADIMQECGALDIDKHAEQWRSTGWTGGGMSTSAGVAAAPAMGSMKTPASPNSATMKVVQGKLQVGKRTVDRGGVRIIERVSETPVQEIVKLRSERAVVERRPVDRAATEADFANTGGGTIEFRETAEEAVVGKTARVVEEVVVGKKVEERTETVKDKVRRKDVEVEQMDEHAMASRGTPSRDTLSKDSLKKPYIDPLTPKD